MFNLSPVLDSSNNQSINSIINKVLSFINTLLNVKKKEDFNSLVRMLCINEGSLTSFIP